MSSTPAKKSYCYSSNCELVTTGLLTQFVVCRTCKLEVSADLEKTIKDRKKKDSSNKPSDDNDDGFYDLMMLDSRNYHDPMGD